MMDGGNVGLTGSTGWSGGWAWACWRGTCAAWPGPWVEKRSREGALELLENLSSILIIVEYTPASQATSDFCTTYSYYMRI